MNILGLLLCLLVLAVGVSFAVKLFEHLEKPYIEDEDLDVYDEEDLDDWG